MTADFNEQPIAWQVSAVDARNDFVTGFNKQPHRERFLDRAAADSRKQYLQSTGMVATVTPIFPPKAKQQAGLKRRLTNPLGDFCATGKMQP